MRVFKERTGNLKIRSVIWFILLILGLVSCSSDVESGDIPTEAPNSSNDGDSNNIPTEIAVTSKIESFTFSSNGASIEGKIFLPAAYETDKGLPAIFLIDFEEQHFQTAADEFDKVIDGVQQIDGFDALVVTLESIPDIDARPEDFSDHYQVYIDMASFVEENYTNNSSRTFIGRGSEAGMVLMALFLETSENSVFDNFIATDPASVFVSDIIQMIENEDFPQSKLLNKLHLSFSTTNDRAKMIKLIDLLEEAQFEWLQFESIEYSQGTYVNTYPISFAEGLNFIFGE